MNALYSFFAVLLLGLIAYFGVAVWGLQPAFGIFVPYAAFAIFGIGIVYRVLKWARAPAPFAIATTCGQQKSLPWVKNSYFENPHSTLGVVGRMAMEVLLFRSLFRNTKVELRNSPARIIYGGNKYLWLGAIAFHYSFLIILLRHFRFFSEPVPSFVLLLQSLDGFFQVGVPGLYLTSLILLAAVGFLLLRRFLDAKVRYISLAADYFPLILILGIALSGVIMRHFTKVDIVAIKELALGLVSLHPTVPEGIGAPFYIHLFFVSTLAAYFPFSKLMHLGGIFLSPTRNLRADSRRARHVNPWNPHVEVHTYQEWEDEFRDKMKAAGLPVERE
ncbi:MAG: sulfate reduction electron transfer complex DsrMKJOP subunit DsrM [bacterium]